MSIVLPTSRAQAFTESDHSVTVGGFRLSLADVLVLVEYALTNTEVVHPNDPRHLFIQRIASMRPVTKEMRGSPATFFALHPAYDGEKTDSYTGWEDS